LGLHCNCDSLRITNCSFSNLTAVEGGAIYLTSNSQKSNFSIESSKFSNNKAM
jgi:hypothetical protein